MTHRLALLLLLIWSTPLRAAQEDPASAALAAMHQLEAATVALEEAESARDRVRAYTNTIRAYETGLAAMREGLRRAATREVELTRRLSAQEGELAQLLGVLLTIETAPTPVLMLHPTGALGSARSGMMLADVTPELQARAAAMRQNLEEVQTLRLLQKNAVRTLNDAMASMQQARAGLSMAIADRTGLPSRFTEDPVRTAILIASTETLAGFASGLSEIASGDIAGMMASISDQKGSIDLPVQGAVLHGAGKADAAGIARDGILVATRPRALVTAPTAATIRYLGPLLDLGNVVILEPQPDTLFVLSGLAEVFGKVGEVVPAGTPIGLMGGEAPQIGAFLSLSGEGNGPERSETLYIEVREGDSPVDPETWFRTDKDG
ncbi:murein hydrolase activator EnvC family protein [Pontibaca salina]|uniref:Peptidoglycan DD-metalloendopeptidase family protein n=1 Tax=Pontibaca salina TaxID=2795731 RepID=A0A934M176_9RHOB|nr:peptidoglycan DD-metalloendopeptidase family protein [Pontibaca salina]MBI6629381.1 peptidoglycan DD-metalloendopeptidase family protein [Pontibaca salina]